ncbi:MAG: LytR C-terminal domain-containing protein [bacterium]
MDSTRRRKKQQEKKTAPSNIRKKRSTSKAKRVKSSPKSKVKSGSYRKSSTKTSKKIGKKRNFTQSKPRSFQNFQINVKDGWIRVLILIFLAANVFLIYNLIKQWSAPNISQGTIVPKDDNNVEEKKDTKKAVDTAPLQIEVLNGCGVSGVAAEFTEYLRQEGFDVVKTDNYESFNVLETVIIDRRGRNTRIKKIASSLGLDTSRILKEINEAYLIDATVVLGKDYKRISSWNKMEHNGY